MIVTRVIKGTPHEFTITWDCPFFAEYRSKGIYLFSLTVPNGAHRAYLMDLYFSNKGKNEDTIKHFIKIAHNFSTTAGQCGGLPYDTIKQIDIRATDIPDLRREAYRMGMEYIERSAAGLSFL